jgi:starch-binding outer membrane protein, SusD/RagB family
MYHSKKTAMLRNTILLFLSATVLLTFSCKKPVDIDPIGIQTKDSVLKTEDDYKALLNSVYTVLAADNYYGGGYQIMNTLLGDHLDQAELSGDWLKIYNRNADIFTGTVTGFYAQPYFAILRANTILDNLDKFTGASKGNFEGQAKFVRALSHFDLVRLYAQPYSTTGANTQDGIVVRTKPTADVAQRSSVAETYAQIIADLKSAETLLPDANGVYPTKWSAKAILARVYFQMNDFTNAYAYANEVITSNKFTFDTDYSKRFSANGTPEAVFKLIYESNNPTGRFNNIRNYRYVAPQLPPLRIAPSFYSAVNSRPTDARKAWFKKVTVNGQDWYVSTKYDSLIFQMPVIHLTELKLIRAESAAELNQNLAVGIADVNDIIRRAFGTNSGYELPTSATAQTLLNAVRREREIEMAFEGDRLQQLKRRGAKGESIVIRNAPWNCNGMIFILPPSEVTQNPGIIQNPTGGCQ